MDVSPAGFGVIGGAVTLLILLIGGFLWLCVAFAIFGINGRVHKIGDRLDRVHRELEYLRYAVVVGLDLHEQREADGTVRYMRGAKP